MRRGNSQAVARIATGVSFAAVLLSTGIAAWSNECRNTVYLTLDSGHMGPAEIIADTLKKHHVQATFFLANEKTQRGDGVLESSWAPYWKARAAEGHAFGSHTWDHWKFQRDIGSDLVLYSSGQQTRKLDRAGVCAELEKSEEAFRKMTGRGYDGIWRAPGGKTTPNTIRFAESCGYRHVGWSPAGFSGDELPSEKFPSDKLIAQQLQSIKSGDILLWHLGIWSRKDPLYPRLDSLIAGLKAKGFCFARMTEHPAYRKPEGGVRR